MPGPTKVGLFRSLAGRIRSLAGHVRSRAGHVRSVTGRGLVAALVIVALVTAALLASHYSDSAETELVRPSAQQVALRMVPAVGSTGAATCIDPAANQEWRVTWRAVRTVTASLAPAPSDAASPARSDAYASAAGAAVPTRTARPTRTGKTSAVTPEATIPGSTTGATGATGATATGPPGSSPISPAPTVSPASTDDPTATIPPTTPIETATSSASAPSGLDAELAARSAAVTLVPTGFAVRSLAGTKATPAPTTSGQPSTTVPGSVVSGSLPGGSTADSTTPDRTTPGRTTPGRTVSGGTASGSSTPTDSTSAETTRPREFPISTKPGDSPGSTKPGDSPSATTPGDLPPATTPGDLPSATGLDPTVDPKGQQTASAAPGATLADGWLSRDADSWLLRWSPTLAETSTALPDEKWERPGTLTTLAAIAMTVQQDPRFVTPDGECSVYLAPFVSGPGGTGNAVAVIGDSLVAQLYASEDGTATGAGALMNRLVAAGDRAEIVGQGGRRWTVKPADGLPQEAADASMLDEIRGLREARSVVIALGTNDAGWVAHAKSQEQYELRLAWVLMQLAPILDELRDHGHCTVLTTLATRNKSYVGSAPGLFDAAAVRINDYLRQRADVANDPEDRLRLWDWATPADSHGLNDPEPWFRADTIHLNPTGHAPYAEELAAAAALC